MEHIMASMEELFANLLEQNRGLVEACKSMLSRNECGSCCMRSISDVCDDLQEIAEDEDMHESYRGTVAEAINEIKSLRNRLLDRG